jgi:hypothetical protein
MYRVLVVLLLLAFHNCHGDNGGNRISSPCRHGGFVNRRISIQEEKVRFVCLLVVRLSVQNGQRERAFC